MGSMGSTETLAHSMAHSMAHYYAARAAEYERVYAKPERQADIAAVQAWLPAVFSGRRVLEVAAGTAWWTVDAAREAAFWLATDLNPETLTVARAKASLPGCVRFCTADAYTLAELGAQRFNAAFVGFWWSHVPKARLADWLAVLHRHLEPGAVVVLMDNRHVPGSSTPIALVDAAGDSWQRRRLSDGSEHLVLKNHPGPAEVEALLKPHARHVQWPHRALAVQHYWLCQYEAQ
jgi:ubiquinone/menaquinone biosynthesis C-methylase UbiE